MISFLGGWIFGVSDIERWLKAVCIEASVEAVAAVIWASQILN